MHRVPAEPQEICQLGQRPLVSAHHEDHELPHREQVQRVPRRRVGRGALGELIHGAHGSLVRREAQAPRGARAVFWLFSASSALPQAHPCALLFLAVLQRSGVSRAVVLDVVMDERGFMKALHRNRDFAKVLRQRSSGRVAQRLKSSHAQEGTPSFAGASEPIASDAFRLGQRGRLSRRRPGAAAPFPPAVTKHHLCAAIRTRFVTRLQ